MSDLIIPDSRFEMPSLFYPGRKPVGNVKINWEHPLSKGLTLCLLMQGNVVIDLVTGRKATLFGNSEWIPDGIHFDEINSYFTVPDFRLDSKFTMSWNHSSDSNDGSGYQFLFSTGAFGSVDSISIGYNENAEAYVPGVMFFSGDHGADNRAVLTTLKYPSFNATELSFRASGRRAEAFSNGKSVGANTGWGTNGMSDGTYKTLYVGAKEDLNADRYFGGSIKHLFVHSQDLVNSEIESLHSSPHQFIIPA